MPETINTIEGIEIAGTAVSRSQVYKATHNGDKRLPYMNRSFISFSYGGRWIEDFNLIAITNGDRLSHPLYSEFTDIVKDPEVYDGQHYWSTHFKANTWSLTLSTDGITENKLEEFKQWFAPGNIRELVLAEHPNRGILARVSRVPTYEMIPFEEKEQEVVIAEETYKTSTTIYRGNISLDFVMDNPFWYALTNLLARGEESAFDNYKWYDVNGNLIAVVNDKDALKIILEDHIPTRAMLDYPAGDAGRISILFGYEEALYTDTSRNVTGPLIGFATIDAGRVAYVLNYESGGIDLKKVADNEQNYGYFFYGGLAPEKPILSFELIPDITNHDSNPNNRDNYISIPRNSYVKIDDPIKYNYIAIESTTKQEFKFTAPGVYMEYNHALKLLYNIEENTPWEDIRTMIREEIKHYAVRAFVNSVIDSIITENDNGLLTDNKRATIISQMPKFIANEVTQESNDNEQETTVWEFPEAKFVFDSATGLAKGFIPYRLNINEEDFTTYEESVGDMVLSDYLIIKDRNNFSEDGYVKPWSSENPDYSHRIYTNVKNLDNSARLRRLSLVYKYRYY